MIKRVLIAAGIVAAVAGGAVALAQAPAPGGPGVHGPGRGGRGGPGADVGLRGVDLTDAQRDQVRAIHESHRSEFDAARTKLRDAHRAFAEATGAATIDEAAIRARSAEVAAAMADEAILRAKVRAEVFAILTPEQQQKANEVRSSMPPRRQRR
jgi:periplasmic protein CpxP/Spy